MSSYLVWRFVCALLLPRASHTLLSLGLDAQNFNWYLSEFIEIGGGLKEFQSDILTKVDFQVSLLNGTERLSEVGKAIGDRFWNRLKMLRNLNDSVLANFRKYKKTLELPMCCDANQPNKACTETTASGADMFPTTSLEETFIQNDRAKTSSVTPLHQHFVTYQGVGTIYPSEDIPCEDNDIKQWQWLISASRKLTDLVIVLDSSTQMATTMQGHLTMWEIARWVVYYLLEDMSYGERVAVLGVSSELDHDDDGLLKTVTRYVRKTLNYHVMLLKPRGQLAFLPVLQEGIAIFDRSPQTVTFDMKPCVFPFTFRNVTYTDCATVGYHAPWCATAPDYKEGSKEDGKKRGICSYRRKTKVLVFICGSTPETESEEVMEKFIHQDSLKDVKVIAFGMGDQNLMKAPLVRLTLNGGLYVPIASPVSTDDIRHAMLPYLVYLMAFSRRDPVFSTPYQHHHGHGIVITLSQSVFDNDKFLGVVGIDMKVADLLREFIYIYPGGSSHFFVMNRETGLWLYHPKAPPYFDDRPPWVMAIKRFELEAHKSGVLNALASLDSGRVELRVRDTVAYGLYYRHGMRTVMANATFYWQTLYWAGGEDDLEWRLDSRLGCERMLDGHVLAEDGARQANLKRACRGLRPAWHGTLP